MRTKYPSIYYKLMQSKLITKEEKQQILKDIRIMCNYPQNYRYFKSLKELQDNTSLPIHVQLARMVWWDRTPSGHSFWNRIYLKFENDWFSREHNEENVVHSTSG